jgi:4-amino-4-deoxy-L-arabinose transferase-like glycosyltransferase
MGEVGEVDSDSLLDLGLERKRPWLQERLRDRWVTKVALASSDRPELALVGRPERWGRAAIAILAVLMLVGLALRLAGLSAEGFADDEVHKWLAANRYLIGDIVGDDIEHPMLMKWLIAGVLLIGKPLGWAPETMVRLPNVLAGTLSILILAQLGRRLYGKTAALIGAALLTVAPTVIGYQRAAKEDTLLAMFLMLVLWCAAEAKAAADDGRTRDQHRWEWRAAASVGGMFASKYFFFFAPIPVVLYLWQRPDSRWRVPPKRWAMLILAALAVFAAVNWTPFMPSSWEYGLTYMAEKKTIHGSLFFMGHLFHNLPSWGLHGTPPWFYLVFFAVKLAPTTVLAALAGLVFALRDRRPSDRVILSWLGLWFLVFSASGSKWGRFFTSVAPAFMLLAGYGASRALQWIKRWNTEGWLQPAFAKAAAIFVLLGGMIGSEAYGAVTHSPHYRLYISPLGGGDRNIAWFFPHCDYYDAGMREAIAWIADKAEPNAEVSTEIDWVSHHYASQFGRTDLTHSLVRRGEACQSGHACYVVVQTGRIYFLNQEAIENLSSREPAHVERINGEDVVKIYRLEPGESPFPSDIATAR